MPQKSFNAKSDPKSLSSIRQKVRDFLKKSDFPQEEQDKIVVAVGEACMNSVMHAPSSKPIEVLLEDQKDQFLIKIRDYGTKIDLAQVREPQLPPEKPRGLGIYFMLTIMDKVEYNTSHPVGNELILVKYKPARRKESAHEN